MAQNELSLKVISIEASQLGWKPGVWKYSFEYEGKMFYQQSVIHDQEGDFAGVEYANKDCSTMLLVWND